MKNIKIYIIALLLLIGCGSSRNSQSYKLKSDYTLINDNGNSNRIIDGPIEWNQWIDASLWGNRGKTPTSVDLLICKQIGRIVNSSDYFFLVFAGSWCEDSESQVPIIYEVFNKAEISQSQIQLVGVNRDKADHTGTAQSFTIEKAPTLVILHKGKEIGRIIEFPIKNWEQDIINLLYK